MALEFMDGFDHYSNITNVWRKWDTNAWTAGGGVSLPAGRFGGNALASNSNAGTGGLTQGQLSSVTTRTVGFAYWLPGYIPAAGTNLLQFLDSGSEQISVRYGAAGTLIVSRNGVTLGTSTLSLIANTWYYIEFQTTIDPSAGAYTLKVSGATWLSATGVNTRATANSSTNGLLFGNHSSNLDDLYVLNSAGTANNTFLGESRILTTEPSGDDTAAPGTNLLWTPNSGTNHYTRVNEGSPDDDTSFVSTSTPGQIDTYTFPAIAPTGVIAAVQVCLCERKDDAGARVTSTEYRSAAGTNYDGTNQFTLNSAYRIDRQIYEVDPATGSAWVVTGLNGGEFGVKCVS
jgi:hypothetical protein